MTKELAGALSKVPEVTLGFWIIKILATTLGETGGDSVTMSMNLGYAIGSFIFLGIFVVAIIAQIAGKRFHPILYWIMIVATTTLGTTMADYVYLGKVSVSVNVPRFAYISWRSGDWEGMQHA